MERKLGDMFTTDGKTFVVARGFCNKCYLRSYCEIMDFDDFGNCTATSRADKTNVCFVLVDTSAVVAAQSCY